MLTQLSTYLGPARVIEARNGLLHVSLPEDETAWAAPALAFPYEPEAGDLVLAIGEQDNYYVIGVLQGTGRTVFTAPGDLEFRAPKGVINLVSTRGVKIQAPEVEVKAGKIRMMARTITEAFTNAYRRVRDTFQLRAGRYRTRVNGRYTVHAGEISERAKDGVRIDGRKINIG